MNEPRLAQLGFIVLATLAVYMFVATALDGETRRVCSALCALEPHYADNNRIAPDFELPALSGGKKRLSDYRGKVVILNFWTKTCRPCLEEMPSLADLAKALTKHENVQLLTISTDESFEDARTTLRSVLAGGDPPFEVLLDPDGEVVTDRYGTKLFPETWFIDPKGVIRARFDGARDWAGALPVDLAEVLLGRSTCPLKFRKRQPLGPEASVCGNTTS